MEQLRRGLFVFRDTCNVYALAGEDGWALVDFGAGGVLEALPAGARVSHVLHTHYHRDQCQGDHRLGSETAILVPEIERPLFDDVEVFWQSRQIWNNYDNTQDRFCRFDAVPVAGVLRDEDRLDCGGRRLAVLPTPGHTQGSVSLLAEVDGARVAFVGDLLYAGGRLWNLASTQWNYNGQHGLEATLWSLRRLREARPDLVCPAHGPVVGDPAECFDLLEQRIWRLLEVRGTAADVRQWLDEPAVALRPHLYWFRAAGAYTYVVTSESGKALAIDCGYPAPFFGPSYRRHQYRPVDTITPWLRAKLGLDRIDTILFTHVHDDHIAAANLLRRVHGTRIWAADVYSDILERPAHYDVPCLWYEPVPPDRVIPLETPFEWEGIPFMLYPLPGHVRYAVAIGFEIDNTRVLATGDQQSNASTLLNNYVYKNRFAHGDYVESARRYRTARPDLIISGHWRPVEVTDEHLAGLARAGAALAEAHEALLPFADYDIGAEGLPGFLRPYQSSLESGRAGAFEAEVKNPFPRPERFDVRLCVPAGWRCEPDRRTSAIERGGVGRFAFEVTPHETAPRRRARLGVEVRTGGGPWNCIAEALVDVGRPLSM